MGLRLFLRVRTKENALPTAGARRASEKVYSGHIQVHKDKVADAAAHDKEMENLMGAEKGMSVVKQGKFQRIDNPSHRINNSPGQEPQESAFGQRIPQLAEYKHTDPSHGNVNHGRKPFGTGDPAGIDEHTDDGDAPHKSQERISLAAAQHDETYRRVGTGDQNKDHHMVYFPENAQSPSFQIDCVIGGACTV